MADFPKRWKNLKELQIIASQLTWFISLASEVNYRSQQQKVSQTPNQHFNFCFLVAKTFFSLVACSGF
jgi:hypothetical protein